MGTLESKKKITNDAKFPGGAEKGGGGVKIQMYSELFSISFGGFFIYIFQNLSFFLLEKSIFWKYGGFCGYFWESLLNWTTSFFVISKLNCFSTPN